MATVYITYRAKPEGQQEYQDFYVDFGTTTSVSRTVNKKTMITPIVSRPMDDAFPIESGNSQTLSFSFKRTDKGLANDEADPTSREISQQRSNAKWYEDVTDMIDRWQARTDGCILHYESDTPYVPSFTKAGYIRSISRTYKNDYNEMITGTLEFTVGTMYVNAQEPPSEGTWENYSDMQVLMSNPAANAWFVLMAGDEYSCIDSVTIKGGSEQSFEYVEMHVPRKKLMEYAPALVDDMADGMNQINMSLMGRHNLILAKADSDDDILIRAYCRAWLYESAVVNHEMIGDAWSIILRILTDDTYGVSFDESHIVFSYSNNADTSEIYIPEGDNVWRVLQICAYLLRCKIFFADDKAYIVDYTVSDPNDSTSMTRTAQEYGDVCKDRMDRPLVLFTSDPNQDTYRRCTGKTKLGKEGISTLKNRISVKCSDAYGAFNTNASVRYSDTHSTETFKIYDANSLDLPELTEHEATDGEENVDEYAQGTGFAMNYITYMCEPQRSVTFSLKEVYRISGTEDRLWQSFFGVSARVAEIIDDYSGESVDNRSVLKGQQGLMVPQKLILSSYKRQYPKGVTEYTFGTISEISLSSSTSQMTTAINSKN